MIELNTLQNKLLSLWEPEQQDKKEFNKIIQSYDRERYLFHELHDTIKKRGYLKKQEFLDICLWKSPRPKKNLKRNREKRIQKITKSAFLKKKTDIERILKLKELHGVQIPMASAILCVYNPKRYGIIDKRVMQVLNAAKLIDSTNIYNLKNWENYNKVTRKLAEKFNCTPREIDKALFAIHKKQQKGNL